MSLKIPPAKRRRSHPRREGASESGAHISINRTQASAVRTDNEGCLSRATAFDLTSIGDSVQPVFLVLVEGLHRIKREGVASIQETDSSSSQGSCQTLLTACTIWV